MQIDESLEQILNQKHIVIHDFYTKFLATHPDLAGLFKDVNLKEQSTMLTMALIIVEAFYANTYPAARNYLRVLGSRHAGYGVKATDLPKFRDCLVETLAAFHGSDWNESLGNQWMNAIDKSIAEVIVGLQGDFVF